MRLSILRIMLDTNMFWNNPDIPSTILDSDRGYLTLL